MTEEVRQLLDSLEEHGKNARRQQQLSELIDDLSVTSLRGAELSEATRQPEGSSTEGRKSNLTIIWWIIGAAAAVLLLWLMIKPTAKEIPNIKEEILVEKTIPVDSVKDEAEEPILEEPIIAPVIAREERPKQSNLTQTETDTIQVGLLRSARNDVAEVIPMESIEITDSVNSVNSPIPSVSETPVAVQKPQRRVIRSLNLVCYECQTENGEWRMENSSLLTPNSSPETTLFGQAQDPNMKNGAMTFELKLN